MDYLRVISKTFRSALMGLSIVVVFSAYGSGLSPVPDESLQTYPFNTVGQVVRLDGETATGTLIADKLVMTTARAFSAFDASEFTWVKRLSDGTTLEYAVRAVYLFTDYLSVADAQGVAALPALARGLVLLELEEPVVSEGTALINIQNLHADSFRMIVGYASDLYSGGIEAGKLHASNGGEAIYSNFGKVESRIYHTGDLKAATDAFGAPVFSFYDGLWSIDGIVVENDIVDGAAYVMEVDSALSDFIISVLNSTGAVVVEPDPSTIVQDVNSSERTATELREGYGRLYSIAPEADIDYHHFRVTQEANYTIESFGDLDVNGTLLNRFGQLIIDDEDSAGSVNYRINVLLRPGDYYLLTRPFSGAVTGSYGISLSNDDLIDTGYFDFGTGSLDVLDLSLNLPGADYQLLESGDVDTFRVVVSTPGHFILKTAGDLDVRARLFTPTAVAIAPYASDEIEVTWDENDDFPGMQGNVVLDEFLAVGEYVVTVEARNSGEFGPYQISTAFYGTPLPIVDSEDGTGSFATALEWTPGEKVVGAFDEIGDRDAYKFVVFEPTDLEIQIRSLTDVAWFLYNEDLVLLTSSGAAVVDPTIVQTLESGTYYLVVAGLSVEDYSLE